MTNPIPERARGWIYVTGIVLGALAGVIAAVLAVLDANTWQPVLTAAAAAVAIITASLARANLSAPEVGPQRAEPINELQS